MGGSLSSGVGLTPSVSRGTDHLRVINVAPSAVVIVASALSPGSLLFPFSDSGFASLSASSSSRPLSLPPPPLPWPLLLLLPWLWPLSFLLFLLLLSLLLLLFLLLLLLLVSPLAPLSWLRLLFVLLLAFLLSLGFLLLPPSVSSPLPSSSLLSASSTPSLASSLPPVCFSSSAGQAAPFVAASSSSSLDFASYQASVLGLSQDYQYLARWYFQSGGSDFRAYLSAFYPHLSSDASCDFASGSSVFFSALRAVASSVPLPPMSSAAPPLLSSAPTVSSSQPPAPPFSAPSPVSVTSSLHSLSDPQGWGVSTLGSASVVTSAPPGFPPLSTPSSLLFVPPPAVSASPSLPPGVSVLTPPSSSLLSSAPSVLSGLSAPALGSSPVISAVPQLPPGPQPSLFQPFTLSDPPLLSSVSALAPLGSASLGFTAGPSGFASAASGSAFGHTGFAPQPGPSSAFPPFSGDSATPSAPPLSEFAYPPDDPFAPGFADPEASSSAAPVPLPLSDSARTEVRRMYQYLVDLFPQAAGSSQAPPPPRSLFEEFFATLSSPHRPVFLTWFERVRSTLAEADSCIAVRSPRFCLLVTLSIL